MDLLRVEPLTGTEIENRISDAITRDQAANAVIRLWESCAIKMGPRRKFELC